MPGQVPVQAGRGPVGVGAAPASPHLFVSAADLMSLPTQPPTIASNNARARRLLPNPQTRVLLCRRLNPAPRFANVGFAPAQSPFHIRWRTAANAPPPPSQRPPPPPPNGRPDGAIRAAARTVVILSFLGPLPPPVFPQGPDGGFLPSVAAR